jgi:hypothetical protein
VVLLPPGGVDPGAGGGDDGLYWRHLRNRRRVDPDGDRMAAIGVAQGVPSSTFVTSVAGVATFTVLWFTIMARDWPAGALGIGGLAGALLRRPDTVPPAVVRRLADILVVAIGPPLPVG